MKLGWDGIINLFRFGFIKYLQFQIFSFDYLKLAQNYERLTNFKTNFDDDFFFKESNWSVVYTFYN